MFSIILVAKNGELMTINILDTNNLFKKIGYKTKDDFDAKYSWNWFDETTNNHYLLQVWGKSQLGKKDNSNKYEFPPFENEPNCTVQGKCAITCFCVDTNKYVSLTIPLWDAFMKDKINLAKKEEEENIKCKKNIVNLADIKTQTPTQTKEKSKRKQNLLKMTEDDDVCSIGSSQTQSTKRSSKKMAKETKQNNNLQCFAFFDANLFPESYLE